MGLMPDPPLAAGLASPLVAQAGAAATVTAAPTPAAPGPDAAATARSTPRPPLRQRLAWTAALLTLAAVAVAAGLWWGHQAGHVTSRHAVVRGHVTEVGVRMSGVLAAVDVREGAAVRAGQVLARLDDRPLRAEVAEVQARLDGLEREVVAERMAIEHERRMLAGAAREAAARVAAARAEVAAARSRADEAGAYLHTRRALLADGMVSTEDVRNAETRWRTAASLFDAAEAQQAAASSAADNARLAGGGSDVRMQRLQVVEAGVRAERARLARAQADLEATLVRAPDNGTVVRWLVRQGGSIDVGRPVVSLSIGDETWIEAWIDEEDLQRVRVGDVAAVTLPADPGREHAGIVESIGATTDLEMPEAAVPLPRFARMRATPVLAARVRLNAPVPGLRPGLSAVVAIRAPNP